MHRSSITASRSSGTPDHHDPKFCFPFVYTINWPCTCIGTGFIDKRVSGTKEVICRSEPSTDWPINKVTSHSRFQSSRFLHNIAPPPSAMSNLGLTPDEIVTELWVLSAWFNPRNIGFLTDDSDAVETAKSRARFWSQLLVSYIFTLNSHIYSYTLWLALIVYDTIATFPQEVKCIWRRKLGAVAVLYTLIRHGTILTMFLRVFNNFYSFPNTTVSLMSPHFALLRC